jgi:Fe-S-cluster containining protein
VSEDVFAEYEALRRRITGEADALFDRYAGQVACRRGCHYCCDDISVLPLELEALRRVIARGGLPEGRVPNPDGGRHRCGFLGPAGECTVYPHRPVICRTHGLPLAYRLYEYDENGRPVGGRTYIDSWCDLNFTTVTSESAAAYFDRHGRMNQARINEELAALNRRFLQTEAGARYRDSDWIRLSQLVAQRDPSGP